MLGFTLSVERLLEFWNLVAERKAETEEERIAILLEMAEEGKIDNVFQTKRTKEQYIKDISREQNVLDLTEKEEPHED